ncbi:alpha-L-fucosidase [Tamlana sp. 2201CG12-4]|uniref:alpha-L-fucosidase n=1 Tax=Tamlana sp. 2201CG12-4 TaxID=3112582 RepID=UPI002DC05DEE|nr:alpha-L-fucosidase [Tamlana sp. 2201CG12-4]MEC3907202.1 alpha-L-fucosidase [Tamlana sp. 2201CG12-4]
MCYLKLNKVLLVLMAFMIFSCKQKQEENTASESQILYEENWKSLQQFEIPKWMEDAKFGIFIHWGPSAVPAKYSDWYPMRMYMSGEEGISKKEHPAYKFHKETFGDQSKFGFKDFIPMFKAEKFNAKAWVELFKKAGAKYVIPVAEHHDGYALYNSTKTRWNSVDMEPHIDILKELKKEIQAQGLIFGASSHLAYNYNFYPKSEKFDTWDSKHVDLYSPNKILNGPISDEWIKTVWWPRTKEIIDLYEPDILWFDFYLDKPEFIPYHKKLAAYYYNKGLQNNKTFVLQTKNMKQESYPKGTHMLDIERGKLADIRDEAWQTDTSIGANSWYYDDRWISQTPNYIIDELIDIVSKNGALLLNVGPKADGTIPEIQRNTLLDIGNWLDINGEAIYGTRPWKNFGEGNTEMVEGHLNEGENTKFSSSDIRFTKKNNTLYAIVMDWPGAKEAISIQSLSKSAQPELKIKDLSLIGYNGDIVWSRENDALKITFPDQKPCDYAYVFKIILN